MFTRTIKKQSKSIPSLDKMIVSKLSISDIENLSGGRESSNNGKLNANTTLTYPTTTRTY